MSESNPIRVFVTHLFQEDADYLRVFEFLESVERFFYLNCSKPERVPPSGGLAAMKDELIEQIRSAEAVFVLASHFEQNEELTGFQLDVAEANDKPVIAIRPYGVSATPERLAARVAEHIEWNERQMADALRRHARLQDTSRWDVVDFP